MKTKLELPAVSRRQTRPLRVANGPDRILPPQKTTRAPKPVIAVARAPGTARQEITTDPAQITTPSEIPPAGAQPVGLSPQGLVDVYCGTLVGDIDAQPAAKELLGTAPDTAGLCNADYIYNQVSALYGGVQLPAFQSPSGNNVRALAFVSGSSQGPYGAFHISGTQTDFDRIVLDSINISGNYSAGSPLTFVITPRGIKQPRLFTTYRGPDDLLETVRTDDPRLQSATLEALREANALAAQCLHSLKSAHESRNISLRPRGAPRSPIQAATQEEMIRRLIRTNQNLIGLTRATAATNGGRQYLSTALFAAELVESFEFLTGTADPGRTDGEAVSRVIAFKLAPEISLIAGFNSAITQQWWQDGHPDFANVNSENDQSTDGNAAGVMFLEFLIDYLGIPLDQILSRMPTTAGAPLGQTYTNLLKDLPQIAQVAGKDGGAAFKTMVSLLQQNAQTPDGMLNLPANGNPFPDMPGARQGGLFASSTPISGSIPQGAQVALGLETQIEQQLISLKSALQRIQADVATRIAPDAGGSPTVALRAATDRMASFGYGTPLPASVVANLAQRVAPFRASQYDQTLQQEFWPHVYNELPGTGPNTDRLQVITGTNRSPEAVQLTGTITQTKLEPDGDLHMSFQPDDPAFPTNRGSGESPLELEIIYAGPVTQPDAKQAEAGYTNPFDISQLAPGARILAAGPLVFDRAHGKSDARGNVQSGLELHPIAGLTILTVGSSPQLSADLASALGQVATLGQTVGSLTSLLQKMQGQAPSY